MTLINYLCKLNCKSSYKEWKGDRSTESSWWVMLKFIQESMMFLITIKMDVIYGWASMLRSYLQDLMRREWGSVHMFCICTSIWLDMEKMVMLSHQSVDKVRRLHSAQSSLLYVHWAFYSVTLHAGWTTAWVIQKSVNIMSVEVRIELRQKSVELGAAKAKLADVERQLHIRVTFDLLLDTGSGLV